MSETPCNGCRTCCRDQLILLIDGDDDAYLSALQYTEISTPKGLFKVLDNRPNGECVHLGSTGCEVYENRPMVCRSYDCRKQFMIMSRNDRRQFKNKQIWVEARKRLGTLDTEDRAGLERYRAKARRTMERVGL